MIQPGDKKVANSHKFDTTEIEYVNYDTMTTSKLKESKMKEETRKKNDEKAINKVNIICYVLIAFSAILIITVLVFFVKELTLKHDEIMNLFKDDSTSSTVSHLLTFIQSLFL